MMIDEIICGDWRMVFTGEDVDLVLTDPPYPDCHEELYGYEQPAIMALDAIKCRQLVFWSAKADFPLSHSAIHIWDKTVRCRSQYERIFERNGHKVYRVYRAHPIDSTVAAQMMKDVYVDHPSQKPIRLIQELVEAYSRPGDLVFDPFCGSGTTAVAAIRTGRHYIGIDISEEYCAIARERISIEQSQLKLDLTPREGA